MPPYRWFVSVHKYIHHIIYNCLVTCWCHIYKIIYIDIYIGRPRSYLVQYEGMKLDIFCTVTVDYVWPLYAKAQPSTISPCPSNDFGMYIGSGFGLQIIFPRFLIKMWSWNSNNMEEFDKCQNVSFSVLKLSIHMFLRETI